MRLAVMVVAIALGLCGPVWADDVTDMIDTGKKLYEGGKYGKAVKELQFAINEIQNKLSELFAAAMPPAPSGWKVQEGERGGMGILGAGSIISRNYRKEGGRSTMTAQLMVDNPMIAGVAMMLRNPMFMRGQRGMKRVRIKGEEGMLKWNSSRRSGELSVIIGGGRIMLKVAGRNLEDKKILTGLMKSWDFDAVKKLADL